MTYKPFTVHECMRIDLETGELTVVARGDFPDEVETTARTINAVTPEMEIYHFPQTRQATALEFYTG